MTLPRTPTAMLSLPGIWFFLCVLSADEMFESRPAMQSFLGSFCFHKAKGVRLSIRSLAHGNPFTRGGCAKLYLSKRDKVGTTRKHKLELLP